MDNKSLIHQLNYYINQYYIHKEWYNHINWRDSRIMQLQYQNTQTNFCKSVSDSITFSLKEFQPIIEINTSMNTIIGRPSYRTILNVSNR